MQLYYKSIVTIEKGSDYNATYSIQTNPGRCFTRVSLVQIVSTTLNLFHGISSQLRIPVVGELYYGLNLIFLDDSKITFLERSLVRMNLYCSESNNGLTGFISQVVTVRGLTLHDHIIMTLNNLYQTYKSFGELSESPPIWDNKVVIKFFLLTQFQNEQIIS